MAHCPSQDWDRYAASEEAEAEAERLFYQTHRAAILTIAAAILANPKVGNPLMNTPNDPTSLVFVRRVADRAALVVQEIVNRGEPDA